MPPDMDLPNFDHDSLESIEEIPILLTPSTSSSYGSGRESPDSELNFANFTERNFPLIEEAPLEQNLQDLLVSFNEPYLSSSTYVPTYKEWFSRCKLVTQKIWKLLRKLNYV